MSDDHPPSHPLPFVRKYVERILAGRKHATSRRLSRGRIIGPWFPGDECALTCGGKVFAVAAIERVECVPVDALTEDDARSFGAESADAYRAEVRAFYPHDLLVQVIRFRVIRKVSA